MGNKAIGIFSNVNKQSFLSSNFNFIIILVGLEITFAHNDIPFRNADNLNEISSIFSF